MQNEQLNWSVEGFDAAKAALSDRGFEFQDVDFSKSTIDPTAIRNELDPAGKLDGIEGGCISIPSA